MKKTTNLLMLSLMISFALTQSCSNEQTEQTDQMSGSDTQLDSRLPKITKVDFTQNLTCRQTNPNTGNVEVGCHDGCGDNNKIIEIKPSIPYRNTHVFLPGQNNNELSFEYSMQNSKITINCNDNGKVNGFAGNQRIDGREIVGTRKFNLFFESFDNSKYELNGDYEFNKTIEPTTSNGISENNIRYEVKLYKDNNLVNNPHQLIEGQSQFKFNIQEKGLYRLEFNTPFHAKVIDYGNARNYTSNLRTDLTFNKL